MASQVVAGFGRGSKKLGIPTANLEEGVVQTVALHDGIYYGFAQLIHPQGSWLAEEGARLAGSDSPDVLVTAASPHNPLYPMVCSLGWNPHFGNRKRSLEVHILRHFEYDFYGSLIRVAICGFIRPEKKFDSVEELVEEIRADIRFARRELHEPSQHWAKVINDPFFHT